MSNKSVTWNGDEMTVVSQYEWPAPHESTAVLRKVALTDPAAHYFCAINGNCFALQETSQGQTCIALVESALGQSQGGAIYVTFALKDRGPGAVKRWTDKWSKRTAPATERDRFDASVRQYATA